MDRDEVESVGQNVERERKQLGLSRGELAERIGCDRSLVSRIERGVVALSLARARQIARALGVTLDRLAGEFDLVDDEVAEAS